MQKLLLAYLNVETFVLQAIPDLARQVCSSDVFSLHSTVDNPLFDDGRDDRVVGATVDD